MVKSSVQYSSKCLKNLSVNEFFNEISDEIQQTIEAIEHFLFIAKVYVTLKACYCWYEKLLNYYNEWEKVLWSDDFVF